MAEFKNAVSGPPSLVPGTAVSMQVGRAPTRGPITTAPVSAAGAPAMASNARPTVTPVASSAAPVSTAPRGLVQAPHAARAAAQSQAQSGQPVQPLYRPPTTSAHRALQIPARPATQTNGQPQQMVGQKRPAQPGGVQQPQAQVRRTPMQQRQQQPHQQAVYNNQRPTAAKPQPRKPGAPPQQRPQAPVRQPQPHHHHQQQQPRVAPMYNNRQPPTATKPATQRFGAGPVAPGSTPHGQQRAPVGGGGGGGGGGAPVSSSTAHNHHHHNPHRPVPPGQQQSAHVPLGAGGGPLGAAAPGSAPPQRGQPYHPPQQQAYRQQPGVSPAQHQQQYPPQQQQQQQQPMMGMDGGFEGGFGLDGEEDGMMSEVDTAAHLQQMQALLNHFWDEQMQEMDVLKIGTEQDFKNHNDLPLARIKRIMKSDEDVRMISAEAPVLFAKACEMFILELTLRSWCYSERNKRRTLHKEDIQTAIQKTEIFDFLVDVIQ